MQAGVALGSSDGTSALAILPTSSLLWPVLHPVSGRPSFVVLMPCVPGVRDVLIATLIYCARRCCIQMPHGLRLALNSCPCAATRQQTSLTTPNINTIAHCKPRLTETRAGRSSTTASL